MPICPLNKLTWNMMYTNILYYGPKYWSATYSQVLICIYQSPEFCCQSIMLLQVWRIFSLTQIMKTSDKHKNISMTGLNIYNKLNYMPCGLSVGHLLIIAFCNELSVAYYICFSKIYQWWFTKICSALQHLILLQHCILLFYGFSHWPATTKQGLFSSIWEISVSLFSDQ
jgi:hypothetical protein